MSFIKKYLLAFIALSICLLLMASCTASPTTPSAANGSETGSTSELERVDVVYFHRTNRCHSCMYAEEQTWYTLATYFINELESGKITFKSINVQDENSSAIIEKYGAYGPQLFISTIKGDEEYIEAVIEFWDFIDDDEGFSQLIRTKVTNALEGTS